MPAHILNPRQATRAVRDCIAALIERETTTTIFSGSPLLAICSSVFDTIPRELFDRLNEDWNLAQVVVGNERFPNGVPVNTSAAEVARVHGETGEFFNQRMKRTAKGVLPDLWVVVVPLYGVVLTDKINIDVVIDAFNRHGMSACRPKDADRIGKELLCKTTSN